MLICWYITLYAQFMKALNRFIAIRNPIYYQTIFKDSNAKYFLGIVVAFSSFHGIIYFFGKIFVTISAKPLNMQIFQRGVISILIHHPWFGLMRAQFVDM